MIDRDLGSPSRKQINSRKSLLLSGAALAGLALAAACGGGKGQEVKATDTNAGLDVSSNTPAVSREVETPAVVVVPSPVPTKEVVKAPVTAQEGFLKLVQDKLKPEFAKVDMAGAVEELNPKKNSKTKTKTIGKLGETPNQLNYAYEEGLDGRAMGWSFTVDQAGMPNSSLETAMSVLGAFVKDVPETTGSWNTKKNGTTLAYEKVVENPDGSLDSVLAIVVPGSNPGKWVFRTGFCHMTAADPNRSSNSCVGI